MSVRPLLKGRSERPLGAVIAVGNQKGGVGKSTNTVHIAAALGEKGYSCLIIDLDPTAGATKLLGIGTSDYAGTLELLTGEEKLSDLIISEQMPQGVYLVPSRTQLTELDTILSKNRFVDKTDILNPALKEAKKEFDFILLDTPPSPGDITTVAAYSSAEWFLLSVFPQPLAIGGLADAINDIALVRRSKNKHLEVLGVLMCAVKRNSNLWLEIESIIKQHFPGRGFKSAISQSVVIERMSGEGRTLFQDKRTARHKVADEYRALSSEIEERVLNREKFIQKRPAKDQKPRLRANQ